jgi:hypothetical protein
VVEAYMDESGIHDGAHVCCIAGYWGSEKKWRKFEKRWPEILKATNEPSLKEFHSTDFWYADGTRKGIFAAWSDYKAEKFINDLADCIVEARVFPTHSTLVVEEWNKLNQDERIFLTGGHYYRAGKRWLTLGAPNKTYFLPFQFAVVTPALRCRAGLHVHYVFDLHKQFRTYASDLYDLMKLRTEHDWAHRLGSLAMESSEKAPGLQAADLLAYQHYKHAKLRIEKNAPLLPDELPPLVRRLLKNMRDDHDFQFFDAEGLDKALEPLAPELRSKKP